MPHISFNPEGRALIVDDWLDVVLVTPPPPFDSIIDHFRLPKEREGLTPQSSLAFPDLRIGIKKFVENTGGILNKIDKASNIDSIQSVINIQGCFPQTFSSTKNFLRAPISSYPGIRTPLLSLHLLWQRQGKNWF
jgi:hypothetical protein